MNYKEVFDTAFAAPAPKKTTINLFELGLMHKKAARAYLAAQDTLNQVRIAERNAWNTKCELYSTLTEIEDRLRELEAAHGVHTTTYITGNDDDSGDAA